MKQRSRRKDMLDQSQDLPTPKIWPPLSPYKDHREKSYSPFREAREEGKILTNDIEYKGSRQNSPSHSALYNEMKKHAFRLSLPEKQALRLQMRNLVKNDRSSINFGGLKTQPNSGGGITLGQYFPFTKEIKTISFLNRPEKPMYNLAKTLIHEDIHRASDAGENFHLISNPDPLEKNKRFHNEKLIESMQEGVDPTGSFAKYYPSKKYSIDSKPKGSEWPLDEVTAHLAGNMTGPKKIPIYEDAAKTLRDTQSRLQAFYNNIGANNETAPDLVNLMEKNTNFFNSYNQGKSKIPFEKLPQLPPIHSHKSQSLEPQLSILGTNFGTKIA